MNQPQTRPDSRRGKRQQREADRDDRRLRIRVLLARAERHVLSREDAAALRALVEAEVAECDTHRRSAGGQQAAAMRLHHTLAAAEDAIREIEAERDQAAEALRAAAGKGCA
ncbi:hypothetical protein ACFWXK_01715 [Streptomyces sp. NPDC059070]|uniref:hypothetical protein n=1 Tax=Streptomyces sp. NPDC059070 TaxID=3346713 RepID=UPI00369EBAB8